MMRLSKTLEEAVQAQDLGKIYSSFYTILLSDPGFVTGKFDNTLEELKRREIPGLMQQYNGKPFEEEKDWSQQYWDQLASELMDNFCEERIREIKKVSGKVYPQQKTADPTEKADDTQKKREIMRKSGGSGKRLFALGVAVLLIVLAVLILWIV